MVDKRRTLVRRRAGRLPETMESLERLLHGEVGTNLILLTPIRRSSTQQQIVKHPPLPPPPPQNQSTSTTTDSTTTTSSSSNTEASGMSSDTIRSSSIATAFSSLFPMSFNVQGLEAEIYWRYSAGVSVMLILWVLYLILPKGYRARVCGAYPRRYAKTKAKAASQKKFDDVFDISSTAVEATTPYPLMRAEKDKREEIRIQREVRRQILLQQLKHARHEGNKPLYERNISGSGSDAISRGSTTSREGSTGRRIAPDDDMSTQGGGVSGIVASRTVDTTLKRTDGAGSNSKNSGESGDTSTQTVYSGLSEVEDPANRSLQSGIGAERSVDASRQASSGGSGVMASRSVTSSRNTLASGVRDARSVESSRDTFPSGIRAARSSTGTSSHSFAGTSVASSTPSEHSGIGAARSFDASANAGGSGMETILSSRAVSREGTSMEDSETTEISAESGISTGLVTDSFSRGTSKQTGKSESSAMGRSGDVFSGLFTDLGETHSTDSRQQSSEMLESGAFTSSPTESMEKSTLDTTSREATAATPVSSKKQKMGSPGTPPSPQHPAVSKVPSDAILSETMKRLRGRGIRLVAHGVQSLPKRVWIRLDVDAKCITWQTESLRKVKNPTTGVTNMNMVRGSIHRISFSKLLYVDVGKRTNALMNKPSIQDVFCFSLLTQNGSLDLQTNSKMERDALVSCFCVLLDQIHEGKDWRAMYRDSPAGSSSTTSTNGSMVGSGLESGEVEV